jgi:hypothetical protein
MMNTALQVIQHMNDGMMVVEAFKIEWFPSALVPFPRIFSGLLIIYRRPETFIPRWHDV